MARERKPETKEAPERKFRPSDLSLDEQKAVVAEYLGVHPDYLVYEGNQIIKPDVWRCAADGQKAEFIIR